MITIKEEPPYVYYRGATFTVEWYVDPARRMKAKDYYEALSKDQQERLYYLVKYFAESPIGTRLPTTLYNLENAEHKIYAFKPKSHRFFNFVTFDRKVIILDAYRKHSQKMEKKDLHLLSTAIEARRSYLKRVKEGIYYEGLSQ